MTETKAKLCDEAENNPCTTNCKNYQLICEVGSGTYGRVFKALCLKTNTHVALKKIDLSKQELEGFPITAVREIKLLRMLDHPNIIRLREIIVSKPSSHNKNRGSTFLVFDYMDHDFVGLKNIKIDFSLAQIKCIIFQILQGVKYLHEKKILHRDLKSANILFNNTGEVKIADFGLARQISLNPQMLYTNKVVTLWYRAPEILLGSQEYGPAVDIWSVGCILVELITGEVIFPGDKEAKQIELIFEKCGMPDLGTWPEVEKYKYWGEFRPKIYQERKLKLYIRKKKDIDDSTLDLIDKLLVLNPRYRITAEEALMHESFQRSPLPCSLEEMPKIDRECHEGMFKNKMKKQLGMVQNLLPRMQAYQELPLPYQLNKNQNINAGMNIARLGSNMPTSFSNPSFNNPSFLPKNVIPSKGIYPSQMDQYLNAELSQPKPDFLPIKPELSVSENEEKGFLFSEKEHNDLHFHSDHSPQNLMKSPNQPKIENTEGPNSSGNALIPSEQASEKKDNFEFLRGGQGLKSLISSKKDSNPQLKREISLLSEKKEMNDLDRLFLPKNQEKKIQKKRVKKEAAKNFKEDEALEKIKKKVKGEEEEKN